MQPADDAQRGQIVNWTLPPARPFPPFTVFEKSVTELQDAMTRNVVTSEDITREYLEAIDKDPKLKSFANAK